VLRIDAHRPLVFIRLQAVGAPFFFCVPLMGGRLPCRYFTCTDRGSITRVGRVITIPRQRCSATAHRHRYCRQTARARTSTMRCARRRRRVIPQAEGECSTSALPSKHHSRARRATIAATKRRSRIGSYHL